MKQQKILFRFQSNDYETSCQEAVPVLNKEDICTLVNNRKFYFTEKVIPEDIEIKPHCEDTRNKKWKHTHLVTIKGLAIGYTNGMITF